MAQDAHDRVRAGPSEFAGQHCESDPIAASPRIHFHVFYLRWGHDRDEGEL